MRLCCPIKVQYCNGPNVIPLSFYQCNLASRVRSDPAMWLLHTSAHWLVHVVYSRSHPAQCSNGYSTSLQQKQSERCTACIRRVLCSVCGTVLVLHSVWKFRQFPNMPLTISSSWCWELVNWLLGAFGNLSRDWTYPWLYWLNGQFCILQDVGAHFL